MTMDQSSQLYPSQKVDSNTSFLSNHTKRSFSSTSMMQNSNNAASGKNSDLQQQQQQINNAHMDTVIDKVFSPSKRTCMEQNDLPQDGTLTEANEHMYYDANSVDATTIYHKDDEEVNARGNNSNMYHDDETLVQNGNNLSDSINNSLKNIQDNQDNDNSPVNDNEDGQDNHNGNHDDDDDEEEEPNWELISQHEPARTDVPLFLSARDRRDAAEERFIAALDEANASLKQSIDDVLKVAADIFNIQKEKLDSMEQSIKQDLIRNEEARANMQKKLEESASAAEAHFTQLMMRVTQFGKNLIGGTAAATNSGTSGSSKTLQHK